MPAAAPLTPADRRELKEAGDMMNQRRFPETARRLEPLVARYPHEKSVLVMSCSLAVQMAPAAPSTRQGCESALKQFPNQTALIASVALLRLRDNDREEVPAMLTRVWKELQSRADAPIEIWGQIAALYSMASFVTWAEQAALKSAALALSAKVQSWAHQVRVSRGLPADPVRSGVPPEKEAPFL
jgi:hypothetical protein